MQPAAWGVTTGAGGDSDGEEEAPRRRRKPTVVWDRLSRQASQASQARGSRSGSTQSNGNGGTSSGGSSRAGSVPRIPALVKAGAGGSSRSSPANSSGSSTGSGRGQAQGVRTAHGRQQQRPPLGSGGTPPGSRNGRQGPTSRLATTASPVLRPAAAAAAAAAAAGRPQQEEHGVADAPPTGPSVSFDITPSSPPPLQGLSVVDLLRGSPGSGQVGGGGAALPFRRDARPTGAWVGGSGQQPQRTSGSNQAVDDEAAPGSPRFVHRVTLGLELGAAASQLYGNRWSTVNAGRPSTHGADGGGWEGRRSSNGRASGVLGSSAGGAEWGQAAGGAWGGAHTGAMRGARKSTRVVLAGALGGAAQGAAVGSEQRQWVSSTTQVLLGCRNRLMPGHVLLVYAR